MSLALDAGVSTRHLSFIESGRARPSAGMVRRLSGALGLAGDELDEALLSAGYAPTREQGPVRGLPPTRMHPPLLAHELPAQLHTELSRIVFGYASVPALAVDAHWGLIAANSAASIFFDDVAPHLLAPPVNVLRLAFDDAGLSPRIANLGQWRRHMLRRLAHQARAAGDPALTRLHAEFASSDRTIDPGAEDEGELSVPLLLSYRGAHLELLQTISTLRPVSDAAVATISIALFVPMSNLTASILGAARVLTSDAISLIG
jgi:hypothetical protein